MRGCKCIYVKSVTKPIVPIYSQLQKPILASLLDVCGDGVGVGIDAAAIVSGGADGLAETGGVDVADKGESAEAIAGVALPLKMAMTSLVLLRSAATKLDPKAP